MILEELSLRDFRNHGRTTVRFVEGRNLLVGQNGEGKTNVLEGIAYLCLGRSFYAANDTLLTKIGSPGFRASGLLKADGGVIYRVEMSHDESSGIRELRIGGADLKKRSDLIGMFPIVILSPEHSGITAGGPAERRKFVDLTLSQVGRSYLEDTLEYRKALKQRNRILTEARQSRQLDEQMLDAWTVILVERGARIMERRQAFVSMFEPYVLAAVTIVSEKKESPELVYEPSVPWTGGGEDLTGRFREELVRLRKEELRMGSTLAGPHRDELDFRINGLSVREYASQGQQKTFLVALKFAESQFLKDHRNESPLLLLDDVFSELDRGRNRAVLSMIREAGQTFITAADERLIPEELPGASKTFVVQSGCVEAKEALTVGSDSPR